HHLGADLEQKKWLSAGRVKPNLVPPMSCPLELRSFRSRLALRGACFLKGGEHVIAHALEVRIKLDQSLDAYLRPACALSHPLNRDCARHHLERCLRQGADAVLLLLGGWAKRRASLHNFGGRLRDIPSEARQFFRFLG